MWPSPPMSRASCRVNLRAMAEALREPTMATLLRARRLASPLTQISGGALSVSFSSGG